MLPSALDGNHYKVFSMVVESPAGVQTRARLTADAYLSIAAALDHGAAPQCLRGAHEFSPLASGIEIPSKLETYF